MSERLFTRIAPDSCAAAFSAKTPSVVRFNIPTSMATAVVCGEFFALEKKGKVGMRHIGVCTLEVITRYSLDDASPATKPKLARVHFYVTGPAYGIAAASERYDVILVPILLWAAGDTFIHLPAGWMARRVVNLGMAASKKRTSPLNPKVNQAEYEIQDDKRGEDELW